MLTAVSLIRAIRTIPPAVTSARSRDALIVGTLKFTPGVALGNWRYEGGCFFTFSNLYNNVNLIDRIIS